MFCLSLCLFLALPEGPCSGDRGSDISAADPSGHDPPGPSPVYLPACATNTDEHHSGPRRSSRVPGLFPAVAHPKGHSRQEAAASQVPQLYHVTQLGMDKESHTCPQTFAPMHSHYCIPKDMQDHHEVLIEMQENVKKCKNFLATLIKLASHNSPSPETSKNVKALVQDLLKSLPALRLSLLNSQQSLTQPLQQGVKPAAGSTPPAMVVGPAVRIRHPNSISTTAGATVLPAGTIGHAAAMVCTE
ncbi:hypothetical protein GOODEAATRI_002398 [Goodea atripinnis]|uniref:TAFH domain-containing protein n=1 Tax=Goodea atripinnis TaxID=208336 RepID=A0ABV0MNQ6_9TELE